MSLNTISEFFRSTSEMLARANDMMESEDGDSMAPSTATRDDNNSDFELDLELDQNRSSQSPDESSLLQPASVPARDVPTPDPAEILLSRSPPPREVILEAAELDQDGLRRRLLAIQGDTSLSESDKARKMQQLLSMRYLSSRRSGTPDTQAGKGQLSAADLEKTYADRDLGILGCSHYRRNCKLQCSKCDRWATCRFCHNEAEDVDHELVRQETKNMLCMYCSTVQPAAQHCRSCTRKMASYFCAKCKLWDNDPDKSIYHCNSCGICRVGLGLGKDFFHCDRCNVCMAMALQDHHKCIERSTDCDCPICGEYMFSSTQTVVFMLCGHSIHQRCYYDHVKTNYKCPTCSKSLRNMEGTFRMLDQQIALQRMPPNYAETTAKISCNDCGSKSTVPYHFVGHKCTNCLSYNTAVLETRGLPGADPQPDTNTTATGTGSSTAQ
ncbi:hypothetical protein PYCC9005_004484 [Savitreella phatthalungensis]